MSSAPHSNIDGGYGMLTAEGPERTRRLQDLVVTYETPSGDSDNDDIEALIRRFYSVFDNRAGGCASAAEIAALFYDSAVIVKRGPQGFESYTPIAFAQPRVALLTGGTLTNFHEWETSRYSRVEGELAIRASRYEKSGAMSGQPFAGTGTKFFQFICVEGQWRILSLAWADDDQLPLA